MKVSLCLLVIAVVSALSASIAYIIGYNVARDEFEKWLDYKSAKAEKIRRNFKIVKE